MKGVVAISYTRIRWCYRSTEMNTMDKHLRGCFVCLLEFASTHFIWSQHDQRTSFSCSSLHFERSAPCLGQRRSSLPVEEMTESMSTASRVPLRLFVSKKFIDNASITFSHIIHVGIHIKARDVHKESAGIGNASVCHSQAALK